MPSSQRAEPSPRPNATTGRNTFRIGRVAVRTVSVHDRWEISMNGHPRARRRGTVVKLTFALAIHMDFEEREI